MVKKKSKLGLHRRKRKAIIVLPFKRYETELPMNGCALFKSLWHKHKRIIKSLGKAPTFSPYKSPLIEVRYSSKQSLMRNKNRITSANLLFQSHESEVSPIEENDDAWEEIEQWILELKTLRRITASTLRPIPQNKLRSKNTTPISKKFSEFLLLPVRMTKIL